MGVAVVGVPACSPMYSLAGENGRPLNKSMLRSISESQSNKFHTSINLKIYQLSLQN